MTGSATGAPPSSRGPFPKVIGEATGILGALVLEAILGVGLSLYVTLPSAPTVTQVFASIPLLTAHIVLGFLLLGGSVHLLYRVRRGGVAGATWRAGLVVLFLLLAIQEGFSFAFTQNNAFVGGMVIGFLGALVVQVSLVVVLRRWRAGGNAPNPPPTPAA